MFETNYRNSYKFGYVSFDSGEGCEEYTFADGTKYICYKYNPYDRHTKNPEIPYQEEFYKLDKYNQYVLHRDGDLPAYIKRDEDGNISMICYYKNGLEHRSGDRPSSYSGSNIGTIKEKIACVHFYKNGKLHRAGDLPAYICFDQDGKIYDQSFFLNDKAYTPDSINHNDGDK